jgi:two-component system LytT family sensor kinase
MLVWSALYFGIKYYLLSQEEKQRYLKAVSMAHEAQLKMLRYQLNPHFLFNTLNAISTLILDKDTQLANSMVMKLSRFLRYSLDNDPMQQVTVAEEIESLQLYLDIEKVRFGERLTLHFSVTPDAQDALMPSLLLQPLVENSIKYAVSQSISGGSIAVSASSRATAACNSASPTTDRASTCATAGCRRAAASDSPTRASACRRSTATGRSFASALPNPTA